jgi:hypothetical protein
MINLQSDNKFDELHLFIDESGSFDSTRRNEIKLVGGVLLFGEYNNAIDKGIEKSLLTAVKSLRGKYPQDLHYSMQSPKNNKIFSDTLKKQMDIFCKENDTKIYSVLIRHEEDIYSDTPRILAEREFDNRYSSMLWSLIEYCVFVSDKVNERLANDATVHLHIARKSFRLQNNDEDYVNVVRSLGYNVMQNWNTNEYYVPTSVNEQAIRGMFAIAMKNQWKTSKRTLKTIDMTPLVYDPDPQANDPKRQKESLSALYLADILLGIERKRLQHQSFQSILPIFESLEYGKNLDVVMRCKTCLVDNHFEGLIKILAEESIDSDDLHNQDIVNRLVKEFKQNSANFYRLYEIASENIDKPKYRNHALQTLKLLDTVYQKANIFDLFSELYSTLISFSAANHSGNIRKAEANWTHYLDLEKQVSLIGKENGLEKARDIILMFRSRRAVNLMDFFDFEAAENIIGELSKDEIHFRGNNSDDLKSMSSWRLGVCYSLMGQACAFQKKDETAKDFFRYALGCFTEPNDIERIWVYCGHLVCDFPETSTDLWNDIKKHLPTTTEQHLLWFEKPFVFAVLLKGLFVFGDLKEKQEWLNENNERLKSDLSNVLKLHPYGLILQTAAMLNAAVWHETDNVIYAEHADHFFGQAIRSLASGEKLLQFLSNACQLRRALFIKEWKPTKENSQSLNLMLQIFVRQASEFGLTLDNLSPEEALNYIRFNYW